MRVTPRSGEVTYFGTGAFMKHIICHSWLSLASVLAIGWVQISVARAMPVDSQMLKPRAYFEEADNNLLEALDLKVKTLRLTKKDFDQCGASLMRQSHTMAYSCTLPIPIYSRISRLQRIVSEASVDVDFGASKRKVFISVSPDAKTLTLSTAFDATGVDYEVSRFNDDFFRVFDKVALIVIKDALNRRPIRLEVLENRRI